MSRKMYSYMNPMSQDAYDLIQEGALELSRCEQHGMRVSMKRILKQKANINNKIEALENEFSKTPFYKRWKRANKGTSFNIYSSDQLRHFLYEHEQYKIEKKTAKGNASTDTEALTELNIPDLEPYLKIGKLKTVRDTFLPSLEREAVNGIIHPFFHLHIPISWRGSSSDPNFQNFPKRDPEQMNIIRSCIIPSKGNQLLELDYGQLEVRISAAYHQDPTMLKYINDPTTDMHRDMAMQIFKLKKYNPKNAMHKYLRNATKNGFVFPAFYGDYHVGFAKSISSSKWLGLPKHGTWQKTDGIEKNGEYITEHLIKKGINHLGLPEYGAINIPPTGFTAHLKQIENHFWNERFPVYSQWKDDWYSEYLKHGFFYNKTGFTFSGVMNKKDCINYPVQSSAFHVLLWSLTQISKALRTDRMKTKIIGQIHDAIVFDVYPPELNKVIAIAKCIMENDVRQVWKWINVPLDVEAELCPVNKAWNRKEDYDISKI